MTKVIFEVDKLQETDLIGRLVIQMLEEIQENHIL